jgi:hypothetical protein
VTTPTRGHRHVRMILLVLGIIVTGCGVHGTGTATRSATGATGTTGTSSVPTTTQAPVNVSSDALTDTLYLSGSQVTLSPPNSTATRTISATAAMAAITSSGTYSSDLTTHSSSGLKFALFTDLGLGPNPSGGQAFRPTYVNHPVWFIAYHNVQWAPSGPGTVAGSTGPTAPAIVTSDEYFIVDAVSGKMILMMDGDASTAPPSTSLSGKTPAEIKKDAK